MMSIDKRYLDNRSPGEIMEERLQLLSQELVLIKSEFQERMDREFNRKVSVIEEKLKREEVNRQESTNNLTLLLTDMEKRFQKILLEREAEIYSSLYHFRIFRWKIGGSVGNVPYIKLTGLRTTFDNDSSLYMSELKLSYLDTLGNEVGLPDHKSEVQIPLANPTLLIRFPHPVKYKTWTYATPYIQNQGYSDTGNPATWVIEGTNDEKNWTILSEGNNQAVSVHSKNRDHMIHIRSFKRT
jgi:hypothetical protein